MCPRVQRLQPLPHNSMKENRHLSWKEQVYTLVPGLRCRECSLRMSLYSGGIGQMPRNTFFRIVRGSLTAFALAGLAVCALAETMVEYSAETRFQLDLHVSDAVLMTLLPAGWTANVATQGPAKDCNLRAVFIDRQTINGPDGKPVGTS